MIPTIPDDWRSLPWPQLRSLAAKVSDTAIRNAADATAAIEAAIARDVPAGAAEQAAPVAAPGAPQVTIPPGWHDTMTVAQIVELARRIDPAGNPVEVIRAEEARRR